MLVLLGRSAEAACTHVDSSVAAEECLSGHGLEESIDLLAFRGEEMVEWGGHDVFADALEGECALYAFDDA